MRAFRWTAAASLLLLPFLTFSPAQAVEGRAADEPVITVHAPDGAWEGWYRRGVNIQANVSSTFPLAVATWERKRPDGVIDEGTFDPQGTGFPVDERGVTDFTFRAMDMFGSVTEKKYGVGIDPDAPNILLGALPSTHIVVGQGAVVPFDFSCSDQLTRVRFCTSPIAAGQPLPTSSLGDFSATVRAEDMVGNVSSRKLNFTVAEPLRAAELPRIAGTVRAGSTLTLSGGTFTPAATVTARWFRSGTPVGTGTSYVLTDDDIGHAMTVQVTGKREFFRDAEQTSLATAAVQRRLFDVTGSLAVRGDAVVGQRLSLSLPALSPAPTTTTYQWYRNGGAINGATGSTYTVTTSDVNATLSAGVVFERTAHEPVRPFTGPTDKVLAPLTVERAASIRGPAVIGRTLTSDAPLFSGQVDRVVYMWLRDGAPIAGATSTSYRLGAADLGRQISLRVVAQSARRPDTESRSAPTSRVAKAAAVVSTSVKARGKARVRISVKVGAYGVAPTGKVTIWRGSKVVARNKSLKSGRVTVNLTRQPRKKVSYKIVYAGSSTVAAKTVRTAKIRVR